MYLRNRIVFFAFLARIVAALSGVVVANSVYALTDPTEINQIGIEEKLGQQLPLTQVFTDEYGQSVTLGAYFQPERPIILVPVYYGCPRLCTFILNGVKDVIEQLDTLSLGKDYQIVNISFNPNETAELAHKKANSYRAALKPEVGDGAAWHFLTGKQENIAAVLDSIGYKYKLDTDGEYAHASAIVVVTPTGKIARYLHGVLYRPQDFKLAVLEARTESVSGKNLIDQVLLYCFKYDPLAQKYVLYAYNLMKAGGIVTLMLVSVFFFVLWRKEHKKYKNSK